MFVGVVEAVFAAVVSLVCSVVVLVLGRFFVRVFGWFNCIRRFLIEIASSSMSLWFCDSCGEKKFLIA